MYLVTLHHTVMISRPTSEMHHVDCGSTCWARRGLLRANCRFISGPGTLKLRSGRAGSRREGFVSAFDVDGGNLCAHRPEIRGELAAMMDRMADPETQVGDGRVIQEADVVHWGGKVLAGQRFETRQALGEVFLIPMGDVRAGLQF